MSEISRLRPEGGRAGEAGVTDNRRQKDLAGADDHEAGAEELVGPEDESRADTTGEGSAAQKVKDEFPKP